jgi:hypothetical protein
LTFSFTPSCFCTATGHEHGSLTALIECMFNEKGPSCLSSVLDR